MIDISDMIALKEIAISSFVALYQVGDVSLDKPQMCSNHRSG